MHGLSFIFALLVAAGLLLRLWLAARQIHAVRAHRTEVPAPFADTIALADHQKAADYTVAKVRLGQLSACLDALVILALTLGGGIAALDRLWVRSGWPQPWEGAAVILCVALIVSVVDLPLSLWRTFGLEARFGFNRVTPTLFIADLAKSAALGLLIGGTIVLGALVLMQRAGHIWWLWAWGGWLGLTLLMSWAWPAFIAPLFNKFAPLADQTLRARIESLLSRCGFTSRGVYVIDGSRRSAHGNAYFTGIGRHKRIVFFDTLLSRLSHSEVEAVLAHELGHFHLRHVRERLLVTMSAALGALALLGWLATEPRFYAALGVTAPSAHAALLLFVLAAPVVAFFATPLASRWSRRHEFAADAFAANHADARELATALVKLFRDNASTLTPDPIYSLVYYSHPPATERIARLRKLPPRSDSPAPCVPAAAAG
ncbi:MAG TPA: M48 family metallopeptidase [Steroidobacteraceae bacterium]